MTKLQLHKIHSDKRGDIYNITEDLKEFEEVVIFTCKKGFARGGCIHNKNDEYCVVIEGCIRYYIGNKPYPTVLGSGDRVRIPKRTSHYFIALKDSIVMEWGATKEEKLEKHPGTRKIVEEINEKN